MQVVRMQYIMHPSGCPAFGAFSPSGDHIAVLSNYSVYLYDVANTHRSIKLANHYDEASRGDLLTFSPDGTKLAVCSDVTGRIHVINIKRLGGSYTVIGQYRACFNPEGSKIATVGSHCIRIRDAENGVILFEHRLKDIRLVIKACFDPNGEKIALTDQKGKFLVWNSITHNEETFAFSDADEQYPVWDYTFCFSADGNKLLVPYSQQSVQLINLVSGRTSIIRAYGKITQAQFSPDNKYLAMAIMLECVRFWDIECGTEVTQIDTPNEYVTTLSFSPDGRQLLIATSEGKVTVWYLNTQPSPFVG